MFWSSVILGEGEMGRVPSSTSVCLGLEPRSVLDWNHLAQRVFSSCMPRVAAFLEGCAEASCLAYADVPFANQDIGFSAPVEVMRVREPTMVIDGARIFSLECSHGPPSVSKHLLELASRLLAKDDHATSTAI